MSNYLLVLFLCITAWQNSSQEHDPRCDQGKWFELNVPIEGDVCYCYDEKEISSFDQAKEKCFSIGANVTNPSSDDEARKIGYLVTGIPEMRGKKVYLQFADNQISYVSTYSDALEASVTVQPGDEFALMCKLGRDACRNRTKGGTYNAESSSNEQPGTTVEPAPVEESSTTVKPIVIEVPSGSEEPSSAENPIIVQETTTSEEPNSSSSEEPNSVTSWDES